MGKDTERIRKLVASWNRFAKALVRTKKAWDNHVKLMCVTSAKDVELAPVEAQRFLSKAFNKSRFDVMIPRMVDYWRTIGGIDQLVVAMPVKVKKKKKKAPPKMVEVEKVNPIEQSLKEVDGNGRSSTEHA